MPAKTVLLFFLSIIITAKIFGQAACTTIGQTPQTAFPVCGTSVFKQQTVPACGGTSIPVPGCDKAIAAYGDLNPYWYSFTCYVSGTLGFLITPNNLGDDYDWELFDVTDHNLSEVYSNASLVVIGNWSGTYGITGAKAGGSAAIECASDPAIKQTTFSKMPDIIEGHNYILLISHFSGDNQSGYSLSFNGGTGSITDPNKPSMLTLTPKCDGSRIVLKLNKRVKCSSLATNGSDFKLSPAAANVVAAKTLNCSNGFDMDSMMIYLDKSLTPGTYSLVAKNGSDSNTLVDNCGNIVATGDSLSFTITPLQPTPFDSVLPVTCATDTIHFPFKNGIKCSTIAPDGSDFTIAGSTPVSIIKAFGVNCDDEGNSSIINVVLDHPIVTYGSYRVTLKIGGDAGTITNECNEVTPAGGSVFFQTQDTVNAAFNYHVGLGCVYDTIVFAQGGKDHVNEWFWTIDSVGKSFSQDSFYLFKDFGTKHLKLYASNGVCSDTSSINFLLDNQLKARFNVSPTTLCPDDVAVFTDSSIGKIQTWYWLFGDGTTSTLQIPPPKKYATVNMRDGITYPVALIVQNNINCFDTVQTKIKALYNCYIAVPSAFTPNGDGLNDYLYPLNAYKADNLEFRVFNRYGQMVFETKDWTKKWNGTINGIPQASGTFVWMLNYTDHDSGKTFSLKGTVVLIR